MKYIFQTLVVICIGLFLVTLYFLIHPPQTGLINNILTDLLSSVTIVVLLFTLQTYIKLVEVSKETLKVSKDTLSFTKTQTSFNSYFDNYKLFNELSKRETSIVLKEELYTEEKTFFENMTFETIHLHYVNILGNYPLETNKIDYEVVFKRFNSKIQSFIDVLNNEIVRIKNDIDLNEEQKINLIDLYKNFLLSDYINLCKDLIKNRQIDENELLRLLIPNYLKCNSTGRIIFDIDSFLKLYYQLV